MPEVYLYYGSCIPGLEERIAEILRGRFPGVHIPLVLSGAVVFETSVSYDRLNLFCFNNIFRVIRMTAARGTGGGRSSPEDPEHFVRRTIRRGEGRALIVESGRGGAASVRDKGFRVMVSLENTPAAIHEDLRREAEMYLASLSGLRVNRSKPDVEFWFLLRREGAFFMRRLSRHRAWDKLLRPGELPPPLAWMLCDLSHPRFGEKVADPFCGYGSIPAARLRYFPPAEFFASDIDRKVLSVAKNKFKGKEQHHCVFRGADVAELPRFIPPASLDCVITDPPWGFYRNPSAGALASSVEELYAQSFTIFAGLLKPGGLAVLLCGRDGELRAAAEQSGFTLVRRIPILLSGKKTAIYVFQGPASPGINA